MGKRIESSPPAIGAAATVADAAEGQLASNEVHSEVVGVDRAGTGCVLQHFVAIVVIAVPVDCQRMRLLVDAVDCFAQPVVRIHHQHWAEDLVSCDQRTRCDAGQNRRRDLARPTVRKPFPGRQVLPNGSATRDGVVDQSVDAVEVAFVDDRRVLRVRQYLRKRFPPRGQDLIHEPRQRGLGYEHIVRPHSLSLRCAPLIWPPPSCQPGPRHQAAQNGASEIGGSKTCTIARGLPQTQRADGEITATCQVYLGVNARRSAAHWLSKNDRATLLMGITTSNPWNAPGMTSISHGTPAAFSRSA